MNITYLKSIIPLAFVLLSMLFPTKANAEVMENYYVSPVGNDNNPGTDEQPFRTIEKARDVIRARTGIWTGDIYVWLRGGTGRHLLSNTLELTEEDSGKDGYQVVYKAFEGERPIVSGGIKITGWSMHANGIFRAECPASTTDFRQLYVNGEKAVRARTPNKGTFNRLTQWRVSSKSIRVGRNDVNESWQNMSNGKVEIIIQQYWAESILRIASVSTSGSYKDIAPKPEERDIVFGREWPQKSPEQAYHLENSLDFLDQEGEWYLDNNTTPCYLYYKPRTGENMAEIEVIAPALETLVSVKGSTLGTKVNHLAFEGITFEHANWTRPGNHGNIGLQQQQYSIGNDQCDRPKAGLFVQNADHVNFKRCVFKNMGSTGLDVYTGTSNIRIEGNVLHTIAGNGMQIGKFSEKGSLIASTYNPSDIREFCENIIITNNYIHDVAQEYYSGCAISSGYVRHTSITHNEVKNVPYTGISLGWGWTKNPCAMTNNTISYNRIYEVMKLLCDGAGIYTLGYSPSSRMEYNFIHSSIKSTWATTTYTTTYPVACIYLDQGSKGYTIQENVLRDAHNNNYVNEGMNTMGDNVIRSNYRNESSIEANSGIQPEFQDIKNDGYSTSSLNLKKNTNTLDCKIYPTVVTQTMNIELNMAAPSPLEISIFNIRGNKVREFTGNIGWGMNYLQFDIGNIPSGAYIFLLQSNNQSRSGKIQVVR